MKNAIIITFEIASFILILNVIILVHNIVASQLFGQPIIFIMNGNRAIPSKTIHFKFAEFTQIEMCQYLKSHFGFDDFDLPVSQSSNKHQVNEQARGFHVAIFHDSLT